MEKVSNAARQTCARERTRAPGFLATGAMPLNRKRPPVTIQVPEVPRAVYELSESGTFTEGNLEISRSGMRIAGARSAAGAGGGGTPGAGPSGDAAAPRKSPRGLGDGSLGDVPGVAKAKTVGGSNPKHVRAHDADGDGCEKKKDAGSLCVVGDSDDAAAKINAHARDASHASHGEKHSSAKELGVRKGEDAKTSFGDATDDKTKTNQPEREPETQTFASDRHDGVGGDRFDFDVSLDELVVVGACGKGAGGLVQKVVHVPTGVFLAVKIVQMNVQAEIRKNIIGELRALHSTRCPYVVAYRGAFFGDGSVSIVLEYADGGSVGDVTRKLGYIEEPPLREIARQTLLGLEYLHCEKKIVHRDVKPSNVLVNTDGSVKIGDFGVSSHLANSVAKCDSWVGTVTYMSPERISGESYAFDSDVWSLGLSLLECATGRFPYPPEDATDKIKEDDAKPKTLGFWDLLDHIVREPAPSLPEFPSRAALAKKRALLAEEERDDGKEGKEAKDREENEGRVAFSNAFREVTEMCLQKRPERRAGARALLKSAWLAGADADYGRAILAETVTRASRVA